MSTSLSKNQQATAALLGTSLIPPEEGASRITPEVLAYIGRPNSEVPIYEMPRVALMTYGLYTRHGLSAAEIAVELMIAEGEVKWRFRKCQERIEETTPVEQLREDTMVLVDRLQAHLNRLMMALDQLEPRAPGYSALAREYRETARDIWMAQGGSRKNTVKIEGDPMVMLHKMMLEKQPEPMMLADEDTSEFDEMYGAEIQAMESVETIDAQFSIKG